MLQFSSRLFLLQWVVSSLHPGRKSLTNLISLRTYVRKRNEHAFAKKRELKIALGRGQDKRTGSGVKNGAPRDRQRGQQ